VGRRRADHPVLRDIPVPDFRQCRNQPLDLLIGMKRGRGQAQALGASRDRWVVDRLDIDMKAQEQFVGYGLAVLRVAH